MPILKVKDSNGEWRDIAHATSHQHKITDIEGLPANIVADIDDIKELIGTQSVAYQIETALSSVETASYNHPTSHPASMITGLSTVATSGSFTDLTGKPTIIDKLPNYNQSNNGKLLQQVNNTLVFSTVKDATKDYVTERLAEYTTSELSKYVTTDAAANYVTNQQLASEQYVKETELDGLVQPIVKSAVDEYIGAALGGTY